MEAKIHPAQVAKTTGLYYVSPDQLTWIRKGQGKCFSYLASNGKRLTSSSCIQRLKSLAIPPSWKGVRICPEADGHLQAIGLDLKGKTQYLYHREWKEGRARFKNLKQAAFGHQLPRLRKKITSDLKKTELTKEYVTAVALRVMDLSAIRVGNEISSRHRAPKDQTFGLTTLRREHIKVSGTEVRFTYKGKAGVQRDWKLDHPLIAKTCKRLLKLDGDELFAYQDEDGKIHDLKAHDINEYIFEFTQKEFTAKDFRTWRATVIAAECLAKLGPPEEKMSARKYATRRNEALSCAAEKLGNTVSMCKSSYVSPQLFEADQNGDFSRYLKQYVKSPHDYKFKAEGLSGIEKVVLKVYESAK